MRQHRCMHALITLAVLFVLPLYVHSQAPYSGPDQSMAEYPTQLVVKYKSEVQLSIKRTRGRLSTGNALLDQLYDKYSIQQEIALLTNTIAVSDDNPLRGVYTLRVPDGTDVEAMAREYERLDIVEYAHPDYLHELFELPNDSLFSHQWALNNTGQGHYHVERIDGANNDTLAIVSGTPGADIQAGQVFDNPPDQTNVVVVAIIDTGVDVDHPDLAASIWSNSNEIPNNGLDDDHNGFVDDTHGWDFSSNDIDFYPIMEDNDPNDYKGHGSHCAGIVAATSNNAIGIAGVAPDAKIMPLRVFPVAVSSVISRAIVYAADNGADVISMSFGGPFPSIVMDDALNYAQDRGVVLVASSGNGGAEGHFYPSYFPQVMSVTASDHLDNVTTFSTFHDQTSVCAPGQSIISLRAAGTDMYIDLDEPGVHIIDSLYYMASGTSMAGPYAASVAAYVRAVSPGLDPDEVREVVESSADDLIDPYGLGWSYPGWDKYSGHGRVNLSASLDNAPGVRAIISSPMRNQILGGAIDIYGCADGAEYSSHVLEYTTSLVDTQWVAITAASTPVTDGLLGALNTSGIEGQIILRLRVGSGNVKELPIYISNAVVAELLEPSDNDTVSGIFGIRAHASCPEFVYSVLEYGLTDNPSDWEVIDTVGVPAFGGAMYDWVTTIVPNGIYSMRLSVYSTSGLQAVDTTVFLISSPFAGDNGWTAMLNGLAGRCANYGDFDGDGVNEIVIGTYTGVQFFNLDGSPKTSGVPILPAKDCREPLAVGNLDGDGIDDIVGTNLYSPRIMYAFPSSAPAFEVSLPDACGSVYLKDIDNDGLDEIHFLRRCAPFRHDGTPWGYGFPLPMEYDQCIPADLDGDLTDEIYCYNQASGYLVQFDTTGQAVDSVVVAIENLALKANQTQVSAVDIDGDLVHELILFGYSYGIPGDQHAFNKWHIFAFDENLQAIAGLPINTKLSYYGLASELVLGDLDGDGELEYVISYGYDHSYNFVYAWHLDGTPVLGDSSLNGVLAGPTGPNWLHDPVLIDASDDGRPDVLLGVSKDLFASYPAHRIVAFDAEGQTVESFPLVVHYPSTGMYNTKGVPTAGDINQDGYFDFVYPWHDRLVFTNFPGVDYYPENAPWPMHRCNRRQNASTRLEIETTFECGDINGSGGPPNIADLVYLVDYMFNGGPPPPDMNQADVDGSGGGVDIADLVYLVDFMFNSGPPPSCR